MVQKYKTVLLTKYYRKHYTLGILRIFSCWVHSVQSCTLKHSISAYIIFYNLVNFLYVLTQLHPLKIFPLYGLSFMSIFVGSHKIFLLFVS